jgi:hypothetical protein
MGFFTEDTEIEMIPRTEGSLAGEKRLMELIGRSPNVPLQGTAGLSPVQMAIQQLLGPLLGKVTEGGSAAQDYYKKILGDNYDLESDPRYQTLMQQAGVLTKMASTQSKRGAERQGMLDSSGAKELEMTEMQKAHSPILQAIGDLLTRKESERMTAAGGIGRAGAQEVSNIAAVGGIADIERSIEQMQADALYNQALMQILFPYQYQANLANALMNYQAPYAVTGGGLTDFGMATSLAAPIIGGMVGGPAGAAAGSTMANRTWSEQKAAMNDPNYYG